MTRHAQRLLSELRDDLGQNQGNLTLQVLKMKSHLRLAPMDQVLASVDGATVKDKCKAIRISRQTYYYWLRGYCRPNPKQARRLAFLTGYEVDEIRNSFRISPPR
jgi:hypothetical protein